MYYYEILESFEDSYLQEFFLKHDIIYDNPLTSENYKYEMHIYHSGKNVCHFLIFSTNDGMTRLNIPSGANTPNRYDTILFYFENILEAKKYYLHVKFLLTIECKLTDYSDMTAGQYEKQYGRINSYDL